MQPRVLTLKCPHCFVPLELPDRNFIGKRAGCPKCEQPVSLVADPQRGVVGILPSKKLAAGPLVHGVLRLAAGGQAPVAAAPSPRATSPSPVQSVPSGAPSQADTPTGPIDFPIPAAELEAKPPQPAKPSAAPDRKPAAAGSAARASSVASSTLPANGSPNPATASPPPARNADRSTSANVAHQTASPPQEPARPAADALTTAVPPAAGSDTTPDRRKALLAAAGWLRSPVGVGWVAVLVVGLAFLFAWKPWGGPDHSVRPSGQAIASSSPGDANSGSANPREPAPPAGPRSNGTTEATPDAGDSGSATVADAAAASPDENVAAPADLERPPAVPANEPAPERSESPAAVAEIPPVAAPDVGAPAANPPPLKPPPGKPALVKPVVKDPINVAERLKQPITRFDQVRAVPARDLIGLVEEMLGVPVKFDKDELGASAAGLDKTMSLRLQSTTVGDILQAVTDKSGLKWEVEGEAIRLRSK